MNLSKQILITGLPGSGKTTLTKKICKKLQELNVQLGGFYTEELRGQMNRVGFDVVTLDGKRGKLARTTESLSHGESTKFRVGQYSVFPNEFENLVLPLSCKADQVLIVDEIGKMELMSQKFQYDIEQAFKNGDGCIIATVPQKSSNLPTVEQLKKNPRCKLYTVTKSNRDYLTEEIVDYITK